MSRVSRSPLLVQPGDWLGGDPECFSASITKQGWLYIRTPIVMVMLDANDTASFIDWIIQSTKKEEGQGA
jgi:hypothetical protein